MDTPDGSVTTRIGLRSGKVLEVKVNKDRSCVVAITGGKVDQNDLLKDLAYAVASAPLFNGQLFRPTSVSEHAVTLSYLVTDPTQQLQALLLPAADALVGTRLAPKTRAEVLAFVFEQLKVTTEGITPVIALSEALATEEIVLLHPARNFLVGPDVVSGLTSQQQSTVRSRVNRRPHVNLTEAVDEYMNRWAAAVTEGRVNKDVDAAILAALVSPGFWPHREKMTVTDISNIYRVPFAKVAAAVDGLLKSGQLVSNGGFHHVVAGSGA